MNDNTNWSSFVSHPDGLKMVYAHVVLKIKIQSILKVDERK